MYLNTFAPGVTPVDMTTTDEFASLVQSATDLGIDVPRPVRYQSRNVVANGLRFHVLEWGEPSLLPVVLLHGGNQTAHSWDLVSLSLADRYHIFAIDQRGHGDSEWPRDGEATVQGMAEDISQIILALQLERPIIMGHSMGGGVTMALLLAHPDIASKAVLVDIGPEVAAEGTHRIREFVRSAREFDSLEDFIERVAAYDRFRTREHISRTARYNLMQRSDGKFVSKHFPGRPPRADGERSDRGSVSLAEVGRISCPTLVVRGERSNVLLADAAERFVSALPAGRLVTVSACGHNVHSQSTAGFLTAVAPFLSEGANC